MSKPIVNMTDWQLSYNNEKYGLSGYADDHPHIGRNQFISYTSKLIDYSFKDDILKYETKNTVYVCPLKHMYPEPYSGTVEDCILDYLDMDKDSDSILDKIIAASAKISVMNKKEKYKDTPPENHQYPQIMALTEDYSNDPLVRKIKELQIIGQKELKEKKKAEEERLTGIAQRYEDCIYIEVSNVCCGDPLAYHLGEYTGIVSPYVHVGTIQDSVLYMKYTEEDEPCSLDFRYFPKGVGDVIETYSWSDNIKEVVIKNMMDRDLSFNGEIVKPGETKEFTDENHKEGLISPDCHNGKSLLFKPKSNE